LLEYILAVMIMMKFEEERIREDRASIF